MSVFSIHRILLLHLQASLSGEKPTLGTMVQQSSPILEPAAVCGEAASKPASSVKPACPANTSPLTWLADLTSGNVNKENKGECFPPSSELEHIHYRLSNSTCCENRTGNAATWEVFPAVIQVQTPEKELSPPHPT